MHAIIISNKSTQSLSPVQYILMIDAINYFNSYNRRYTYNLHILIHFALCCAALSVRFTFEREREKQTGGIHLAKHIVESWKHLMMINNYIYIVRTHNAAKAIHQNILTNISLITRHNFDNFEIYSNICKNKKMGAWEFILIFFFSIIISIYFIFHNNNINFIEFSICYLIY